MKQKREERRKKIEEHKKTKLEREAENERNGIVGDVDFEMMIDQQREKINQPYEHLTAENLRIAVCVRKRPIFPKELATGELDCVSVSNPLIKIHECKLKIDGITKFIENHEFSFDNAFHEGERSEAFYLSAIRPLMNILFDHGIVTCFAYGQTGSGKTFTMNEIENYVVKDLFSFLAQQGCF